MLCVLVCRMGCSMSLDRYKDPEAIVCGLAAHATGRIGIRAVVDLHEQSTCQTPYNLNVVP